MLAWHKHLLIYVEFLVKPMFKSMQNVWFAAEQEGADYPKAVCILVTYVKCIFIPIAFSFVTLHVRGPS